MRFLFVRRANTVDVVSSGLAIVLLLAGKGWLIAGAVIVVMACISVAGEHHYGTGPA